MHGQQCIIASSRNNSKEKTKIYREVAKKGDKSRKIRSEKQTFTDRYKQKQKRSYRYKKNVKKYQNDLPHVGPRLNRTGVRPGSETQSHLGPGPNSTRAQHQTTPGSKTPEPSPAPNHTWVQDLTRPRSRIESHLSSDQITFEPRNDFGMCHTPRAKGSKKGTDNMKLE